MALIEWKPVEGSYGSFADAGSNAIKAGALGAANILSAFQTGANLARRIDTNNLMRNLALAYDPKNLQSYNDALKLGAATYNNIDPETWQLLNGTYRAQQNAQLNAENLLLNQIAASPYQNEVNRAIANGEINKAIAANNALSKLNGTDGKPIRSDAIAFGNVDALRNSASNRELNALKGQAARAQLRALEDEALINDASASLAKKLLIYGPQISSGDPQLDAKQWYDIGQQLMSQLNINRLDEADRLNILESGIARAQKLMNSGYRERGASDAPLSGSWDITFTNPITGAQEIYSTPYSLSIGQELQRVVDEATGTEPASETVDVATRAAQVDAALSPLFTANPAQGTQSLLDMAQAAGIELPDVEEAKERIQQREQERQKILEARQKAINTLEERSLDPTNWIDALILNSANPISAASVNNTNSLLQSNLAVNEALGKLRRGEDITKSAIDSASSKTIEQVQQERREQQAAEASRQNVQAFTTLADTKQLADISEAGRVNNQINYTIARDTFQRHIQNANRLLQAKFDTGISPYSVNYMASAYTTVMNQKYGEAPYKLTSYNLGLMSPTGDGLLTEEDLTGATDDQLLEALYKSADYSSGERRDLRRLYNRYVGELSTGLTNEQARYLTLAILKSATEQNSFVMPFVGDNADFLEDTANKLFSKTKTLVNDSNSTIAKTYRAQAIGIDLMEKITAANQTVQDFNQALYNYEIKRNTEGLTAGDMGNVQKIIDKRTAAMQKVLDYSLKMAELNKLINRKL